jgi:GNAT superfamily N-acetyltransferase
MEIIEVPLNQWQKYCGLCSVPSIPFPQGRCFVLRETNPPPPLRAAYIDVAFCHYGYPFRNSPFRLAAFPFLRRRQRRLVLSWVNQNIRLLTRIVVLKEWRRRGFAAALLKQTLPLLDVPYVECVTQTAAIAALLTAAGFTKEGELPPPSLYYYLWRRRRKF